MTVNLVRGFGVATIRHGQFTQITIPTEPKMKIGVLGSGIVGQTIGAKLIELGHDVVLGTRDPNDLGEKHGMAGTLDTWLMQVHGKARVATFADAASHGTLVINATNGMASLQALTLAGEKNLEGKIIVDISNALDFSKGMPPRVLTTDRESLGEQIQARFPNAKIVKTLNTVNALLMVNPQRLKGGDHTIFVGGNDSEAKGIVVELLRRFGWEDIVDLGDITSARATELIMPLWLRLWGTLKTPGFNIKVVRDS
jgi:8-hydroxy-5-deazaflavin:NADPH oxidoreductase